VAPDNRDAALVARRVLSSIGRHHPLRGPLRGLLGVVPQINATPRETPEFRDARVRYARDY